MKTLLVLFLFAINIAEVHAQKYHFPEESETHEGTWLQWPHEYQYGKKYVERLDNTWVAMTKALVASEKVFIVAYNDREKTRITNLLKSNNVPMARIQFFIYKTDDFWARDNGPIFVKDNNGKILIQDWGFNGWGKKAKFDNCDEIPSKIAEQLKIELVDLNDAMINEGGSVEIDGHGTLMGCRSSIINKNRNPGMTQEEAEAIFEENLGVSNFIWLNGKAGLDITDMHIDGFARFANAKTIITMNEEDLDYWQVPEEDFVTLMNAKNTNQEPYKYVILPLTDNEVTTTYNKTVGKASYINYYIANKTVLVPNYNDANDKVANALIQKLYPTRKVVGIDCRNLFANGGMIHCVTQQQPLSK